MGEKQRRYKFGDYILRERKGRYYVYKLETVNGETKERYVGPLIDVVETYLKMKENSSGGVGVSPTGGIRGYPPNEGSGRDLNPGPTGPQPVALTRLSYPSHQFSYIV